MSDASGRLTPERAARLLRAKAGELEALVLDGTDLPNVDVMADVALIAHLLADHLDDHDRHYD